MKKYIQRIFENVKWWQPVFWWVFRGLMFAAMFFPLEKSEMSPSQNAVQMGANFAAMFLWEFTLLFPEKTFVRKLPSSIQNVTVPFIWLAAYCGAHLGFYYSIWWWDAALHAFGSLIGVILCYEIFCAVQKQNLQVTKASAIIIEAVGLCFFFGVVWELLEFSCDQVLLNSDTQHWDVLRFHEGYRNIFTPAHMPKPDDELMRSIAEAAKAGLENKVTLSAADLKYYLRMALMDTMSDIACNAAGGICGFILLMLFPYRHKGKNDVNKWIADKLEEEKVEAKADTGAVNTK